MTSPGERASEALQPVLACRGLAKRFGVVQAVREVGFTIAPGETYGLLGPNGAGKTTTISIVCGLLEPDSGEVLLEGARLTARSVGAKAGIGYVPAGARALPRSQRASRTCASSGEPYLRDARPRAGRTDRRSPGVDRSLRPGERQDRAAVRRDEAAPLNIAAGPIHGPGSCSSTSRPSASTRSRASGSRRLDRRARRGVSAPLHHPLHGGGRAPLRPRSRSLTEAS